jgi:hypothetical protein
LKVNVLRNDESVIVKMSESLNMGLDNSILGERHEPSKIHAVLVAPDVQMIVSLTTTLVTEEFPNFLKPPK